MSSAIAKILVYGDLHLSSKNYGAHNNYPEETLGILKKIADKAEEVGAKYVIGLGDLSFGRFNTLEYRDRVETELNRILKTCNGNHYFLKGNHDSASYGMTEYEYYIKKGLIKEPCDFDIGEVSFKLINYGEIPNHKMNLNRANTNFVFVHDFVAFKDSIMPNYGKPVLIDELDDWFGVDFVIAGHIHKSGAYEGAITKEIDGQTYARRVIIDYPGCMSRPSYQGDETDKEGHMVVLTVYSDGNVDYDRQNIELLPIEESFNLAVKQAEKEKEEEKKNRVDITDIVSNLDTHERSIGDPESIIMGLNNIAEKYKNKAIELLKLGEA